MRKCTFQGCDKKHEAKGLCGGHYGQKRKGLPLTPLTRGTPWTLERILANTTRVGECLVYKREQAYANVRHNGEDWGVHRLAYFFATGDDPTGFAVHHTCANTRCVNPDHLQKATQAENNLEMRARNDYIRRIEALEARVAELEGRLAEYEKETFIAG